MLQVVLDPGPTPAVLGEGVDAAPQCNDKGIEELLRPVGAAQEELPHEQEEREHDTISDERRAHDEMRETLSQMVIPAETKSGDAAKEHLHPGDEGKRFANYTVNNDEKIAKLGHEAGTGEVEFEIETQEDLDGEGEVDDRGEGRMHIVRELATFVLMAKEVAGNCEDGPKGLEGNVPAGAGDLDGCGC